MKKFSIKSIIATFFVIAFSFIAFFVIATFKNLEETKSQNSKVNVSLQVLLFAQTFLNRLQEFEAVQQDYSRLPKEKSVPLLSNAIAALTKASNDLTDNAATNHERKADIDLINRLVIKKIAAVKEATAMLANADAAPITGNIQQHSSKLLSDSIRTAVMLLEEKDQAVLSSSNQYLEDIAQKTTSRFLFMVSTFFFILIIFLLNILADLKKREKSSEQLRYQASLIETIPDAIFTTDKNFIIKTWNKYAAELYGLTAEEAIGKTMQSLFTIQIDPAENNESLSSLNNDGFYKDEYLITKKNNENIFVLASINTLSNSTGEISGYVAVHRDITERRKLEDRQKEFSLEMGKQVKIKTAETTNILERITDGFLALDNQFTFSFVNKKAGEILGYLPEDMIGKNIFRDFPETISAAFNNACLQSFQTQQYHFLENHYLPLDSWLENDIYPSPDGLSVFFKDSTFKKKTELALQESEERYRHLIEG